MDAWIDVMSNGEYSLDGNDDERSFNVENEEEIEVDSPENTGSQQENDGFGDEDELKFGECEGDEASVCGGETLVMVIEYSDEFLKCEMVKELRECVEFINEERAGFEMLKVIYE